MFKILKYLPDNYVNYFIGNIDSRNKKKDRAECLTTMSANIPSKRFPCVGKALCSLGLSEKLSVRMIMDLDYIGMRAAEAIPFDYLYTAMDNTCQLELSQKSIPKPTLKCMSRFDTFHI
ncbi:MAG: hypothetical protein GY702_10685 [Desulfobulbaceae bacterium]|nr:hypothetical protein [Desulfobulbaceae bacterium]